MKGMSESWCIGYAVGKKIKGSAYPAVIDDFSGDRDEFILGLRFAGYYGEVRFSVLQ